MGGSPQWRDIFFRPDGKVFYVLDKNDKKKQKKYQYNTTTDWQGDSAISPTNPLTLDREEFPRGCISVRMDETCLLPEVS